MLGDSYDRMGDRFEDKSAAAYTRIVKDYPLSPHAPAAKERLAAMKRPVPDADPVAYARMKYELENRNSPNRVSRFMDAFKRNPDTSLAAKGGSPAMGVLHPGIPVSVPVSPGGTTAPGAAPGATGSDVTVALGGDTKELDSRPDARANPPVPATAPTATAPAAEQTAKPAEGPAVGPQQPFATNHPMTEKDRKLAMKMAQEKAKRQQQAAAKAAKAAKKPGQPQPQPPAQTPAAVPAAVPAQAPTPQAQTPPQDK
jgi:outer membrane protein assembly factor BamD